MALSDLNHHPADIKTENRCAAMFCLLLLGFFAIIGAISYLVGML